jgi:formylglycine-generating enzyme required for sulfatase activity
VSTITISGKALEDLRSLLSLDHGRPRLGAAPEIVRAIHRLQRVDDLELLHDLVTTGFLRHSRDLYDDHVAPLMRQIPASSFTMGTPKGAEAHFCGESPSHLVDLSTFEIAAVTVTNELFALIDPSRSSVPVADRDKPAISVTWYEAALFALWVGCRLPTECEWEFCCGAGSEAQWCCREEDQLPEYAWFSENSGGKLHASASREPNALGLFDLHGNVWEWCEDVYDQDFYESSPRTDPVPRRSGSVSSGAPDRVCRGGSLHALAEMCRTRYRFHEPPAFWAADLGFRLARDHRSFDGGD